MRVNVKKFLLLFRVFVILLTFNLFFSCKSTSYSNYKIEGKKISITTEKGENEQITTFIAPYKETITKDLDHVLSFAPETFDKSKGKWQTNIGNLFATIAFEAANPIFQSRENKTIDFCVLNNGGIRSIIPQGPVTTRTAYEVMPFENSLIIVGLKGDKIRTLANYYIEERKPHPLYGIKIYVSKSTMQVSKIEINGKLLDDNTLYYIATSDYLANGGDNMVFFKESTIKYDIQYKLRNMLIDYFKKNKTLPVLNDEKIILE